MAKQKPQQPGTIALNRKARHDYHIEDRFEAGIVLEGWEVKSIRAGRVQLADSHVIFRKQEAWLLNMHITPLETVSTHVKAHPVRTRKLLLSRREINKLMGQVQQQGYSVVPLNLHWKRNHVKVEIALVKGKKLYDKRADQKQRDWQRDKARILKRSS